MKRIFAIILSTVLVLGALAACGTTPAETTPAPTTPTPTTPADSTPANPPTEEELLIMAIEDAWLASRHYPARWLDEENVVTRHFGLRNYGTYNGYVILFHPESAVIATELAIKQGVVLRYDTAFQLYAYKDGALCTAKSLFESGTLVMQDARDILACHKETEARLNARTDLDYPYALDGAGLPTLNAADKHDLGTYGDCRVTWEEASTDGLDAWYVLGGSGFLMNGSAVITVTRGAESCPLESAFNQGYLSSADMRAIAYYYHTARQEDPTYRGHIRPTPGRSPYTKDQLKTWGLHVRGSFHSEDGYLGTYNGYSVYAEEMGSDLRPGNEKQMIGGVAFLLGDTYYATACKDGETHRLEEAYELGLLTVEDLEAIAYYWYGDTFPEL